MIVKPELEALDRRSQRDLPGCTARYGISGAHGVLSAELSPGEEGGTDKATVRLNPFHLGLAPSRSASPRAAQAACNAASIAAAVGMPPRAPISPTDSAAATVAARTA